MSAYIVSENTIHAIVKGFEIYGKGYRAEGYKQPTSFIIDLQEVRNGIGQSLLEQNYKSVNYRYREETEVPKYRYKDIEVDAGIILGCIKCYSYQACETDDFFESGLYSSLQGLKEVMLERFIENAGHEIPWGI